MNAPDATVFTTPTRPMPHVLNTYGRLPIALSYGQGCWLWDTEGRKYLDGLGGIAVNTLGHAHPKLVPALQDQVARLIHTSNYYEIPLQEQLAAKLCEISGLSGAFFCNSGLEANEAALKIARKYGHDRGIDFPEVIVYERAFHGRSIATLSATGNPKVQAGFGPLVQGFVRVPLNDLGAVQEVTRTRPNVVAVFLETIQGEGGVNSSRWEYLQGLRRLCDEQGWLLMLDEVQCGIGRTGKWFAHQWAGVQPDVMPLAKGLGSGVPIGAVVCGPRAVGVLGPGNHGTTFGGNPLAMRAGVETLRIIEEDGLMGAVEGADAEVQDAGRERRAETADGAACGQLGPAALFEEGVAVAKARQQACDVEVHEAAIARRDHHVGHPLGVDVGLHAPDAKTQGGHADVPSPQHAAGRLEVAAGKAQREVERFGDLLGLVGRERLTRIHTCVIDDAFYGRAAVFTDTDETGRAFTAQNEPGTTERSDAKKVPSGLLGHWAASTTSGLGRTRANTGGADHARLTNVTARGVLQLHVAMCSSGPRLHSFQGEVDQL